MASCVGHVNVVQALAPFEPDRIFHADPAAFAMWAMWASCSALSAGRTHYEHGTQQSHRVCVQAVMTLCMTLGVGKKE